jgi:hypothetical protein
VTGTVTLAEACQLDGVSVGRLATWLRRGELATTAEEVRVITEEEERGTRTREEGPWMQHQPLAPDFWILATDNNAVDWTASKAAARSFPTRVAGGVQFLTREARGVHLQRDAVAKLVGVSTPPTLPRLGSGGRPSKYDWEGAIFELVRLYAHDTTSAKDVPELVRHLSSWFMQQGVEPPDPKDIRVRVKRFKAVTEGEN